MSGLELDPSDERILVELLSGERSETDAAVVALFARTPQARAHLAELRQLSAELDASGLARQSDLANLRAAPTRAELDEMERTIAAHRANVGQRRRRSFLLAAAAATLAFAAYWATRSSPAPSNPRLGAPPASGSPVGTVPQYGAFAAEHALAAGERGWFLVYAEQAGREREIARSEPTTRSTWQPDPATAARIEGCPAIRWEFVIATPESDDRVVAAGRAHRAK